jgi:hypothetical protein
MIFTLRFIFIMKNACCTKPERKHIRNFASPEEWRKNSERAIEKLLLPYHNGSDQPIQTNVNVDGPPTAPRGQRDL